VSTFGCLSERSEEWLQRLLRRLVTAGWVGFAGGDRPVAVLTETGRGVMRGDLPARIVLPSERRPGARGSAVPAGGRGSRPAPAEDLDAAAQELFEALRAWRLETARALHVPPYVVASDRALRDVALLRPRSHDELLMCHGIGRSRAERHGEELLRVVRAGG